MWEGVCSALPCPGRRIIEFQSTLVKPHRESVDNLAAGTYTLNFGGIGSGSETAIYEIRLTPN